MKVRPSMKICLPMSPTKRTDVFFLGASWAGSDGGLQKVSWLAGFQKRQGVIFFNLQGQRKKTHGKVWRSEKSSRVNFLRIPYFP